MRRSIGKVVVCLATTACLVAGGITRTAALSVEAERRLGRRFALAARTHLSLIDDPAVTGYVRAVGRRIAGALDHSFFKYRFFVVKDARVNAFAVPGGYVYVNSGLLTRIDGEDELAAVLGHEIAHVNAHHLARQQDATQLMNYAALLGALLSVFQPAIGAVASAANAATQLRYSREFEQEADYMGVRYARRAGYNPQGMLDFLEKLKADQRLMPAGVPPYLLSHPLTDERLNRLEAVLKSRRQGAPTTERRKDLKLERVQALVRAQTEAPGDVLNTYRTRIAGDPGNLELRYLFGLVCLETGQFEAAREALQAAYRAGVPGAARALGRLALRSREPEKARRLLAVAVEANAEDAGAHADLAQALEVLGDVQGALHEYRLAISLAPDLATAHHALGMLAGREGRDAEGFYHLASAMYLRGKYAEALNQYRRAEQLFGAGTRRAAEIADRIKELADFLNVQERARQERRSGQ